MTKQVRDWQEDMEMCEQSKANGFSDGLSFLTILPEIGIYWLQQYAAEKERADKSELSLKNATYLVEHANNRLKAAEAREKKLREEIEWIKERSEIALDGDRDDSYGLAIALKSILHKSRISLNPKEETK